MMKFDNIIVGAGISGIVIAENLANRGESVLIIEKRNHIGGNCFDYYDENGILIHKYGPHLFHTNYKDVWNYLNKFTEFSFYQHHVIGFIDSKLIPIPFNLNSLYIAISPEYAKKIENTLLTYFEYGSKVSIMQLREKAKELNNKDISFIAEYIFEKIFKNYTIKQWGISPEEINEDVLKRVPIVISKDDRYFHDKYQGMPKNGYTKMFEKMLDNKNIKVLLNTDYKEIINNITYGKLFFTGPIDEYFNYKYGKLEYKKTLYDFKTHDKQSFQEGSVVNYPNDYEYTRITEMKKFYPNSPTYDIEKTVTCTEYPGIGDIDAYPVESKENIEILEKYKKEITKNTNIYFAGRLANFKYFNMDQTVKNALDLVNSL